MEEEYETIVQDVSSPRKKKKRYDQKYRKQWEHISIFKGWLTNIPDEPTKAYCKVCKHRLNCGKLDLEKHHKSHKHQRNWEIYFPKDRVEDEAVFEVYSDRGKDHIDIKPEIKRVRVNSKSESYENGVFFESPAKITVSDASEVVSESFVPPPITDEFAAFGQYVGLELKTANDPLALQIAKFEISKVLYNLTTGQYDDTILPD